MNFKTFIEISGMSQRQLAKKLGISLTAVNRLLNNHEWPSKGADELRNKLGDLFPKIEIPQIDKLPTLKAGIKKDKNMLRKQSLLPDTRRFFHIPQGDPFGSEVRSADDLYLDDNLRYVREAIYITAKHGGMMAVTGESGSGKSTLRRDFLERVKMESQSIIAIEPYVIAMEEDVTTGKPMRAMQIAESILLTLDPTIKIKRSPEVRFRQLHKVLQDSARAGNKHVLIIEEAHALSRPTLKQLKRFYELEDGYTRLLSIILIGQPELKAKLGEASPEVREVVQRMELVELHPVNDLEGYLRHRMARAALDFDKLFAPNAIDALRLKHAAQTPQERGRGRESISLLYPLAVGNTLTAAFNLAAKIGIPQINADIINKV